MPLNRDSPTDYSSGGRPTNRGTLRRLNPLVFLTICCTLFIIVIVASLIVLTFLPIYKSTEKNQIKYQVQSDTLTLTYNLPDKLSISSMNWSYKMEALESDELDILQNLLQYQLNKKKITKKTSITVMDAYIERQISASTNLLVKLISPVTLDDNNNTIITITRPDDDSKINSTNQLIVSLMLRYALECAKKCQHNLKESIFEKTFHTLELPVDTFQTLFIDDWKISTTKFLSSFTLSTTESTTPIPCIVNTPSSILASSTITARNYEAESSWNTFISTTTIESCSVCSGKKKVSNIGFNNELIFQQITSQYGGSTIIVFYYTTDRIRFAEITVNDLFPSINVTFPIMSPNQDIASLLVTLNLCQGLNSIRIYNPNDYTPDFDRIAVY